MNFTTIVIKVKPILLNCIEKFKMKLNDCLNDLKSAKKTNKIGVRGLLIDNHYLFYEIFQEHIVVLAVWENSQNPSKLKL